MSRLSKYCPANSSPQRLQSIWFHEKGQNKNMLRARCFASGSKKKKRFVYGPQFLHFPNSSKRTHRLFGLPFLPEKTHWNLSWGCAGVVSAGVLVKDSFSFASDGADSGLVGHAPSYESIIFPNIPKHIIYNLDPIRSFPLFIIVFTFFDHIGLPHGTPQGMVFSLFVLLLFLTQNEVFQSPPHPTEPPPRRRCVAVTRSSTHKASSSTDRSSCTTEASHETIQKGLTLPGTTGTGHLQKHTEQLRGLICW